MVGPPTAWVAETEARLHAVPEWPVKIVAVDALSGGRGREAFYSTVVGAKAEDVLTSMLLHVLECASDLS